MAYCWSCGTKITVNNFSKEHIIPNALCGKHKPKTLLCRKCNSKYDDLDRSLSKDLDFILANVKCKRDRGDSKPLTLTAADGNKYIYKDGMPRLKAPIIPDKPEKIIIDGEEKEIYKLTARNLKELEKLKEGLKKRHPDKIFESGKPEEKNEYLGSLPFNSTILSDDSYRGIAKIATNFYIWNGGKKEYIQNVIDYIKGLNEDKIVGLYYPVTNINKKSCDIKHKIYLNGNKEDRVLYCYIELFDALNFIVLLNDNYDGEDSEELYELDVEKKDEISGDFKLNLTKNEIKTILNSELPLNDLKIHIGLIERLISSKRSSEVIIDLIKKEFLNNSNSDFRFIWRNTKLKLNKYPNWDIWASSTCNKVDIWDQNGPKCSCGSNEFRLILAPLILPREKIAGVLLLIGCKNCGKELRLEFLTSY